MLNSLGGQCNFNSGELTLKMFHWPKTKINTIFEKNQMLSERVDLNSLRVLLTRLCFNVSSTQSQYSIANSQSCHLLVIFYSIGHSSIWSQINCLPLPSVQLRLPSCCHLGRMFDMTISHRWHLRWFKFIVYPSNRVCAVDGVMPGQSVTTKAVSSIALCHSVEQKQSKVLYLLIRWF